MQHQYCYIEFEIESEKNFIDLEHTFELIKEAKNTGFPQPDISVKKHVFVPILPL
jgi:hypothetical protein